MNIKVTTAPSEEPVTVSDVKGHLRLSSNMSADDTYLDGVLKAVRRRVERYLRRSLITQTITWELDANEYEDPLWLPRPPHQSVTSVKTFDEDDAETTVSSTNYRVYGDNPLKIIQINNGFVIDRFEKAVEVIFVAGYGDRSSVPEDIRQAIRIEAARMYMNRGDDTVPPMSGLAKELLHNYRYDYL